MKTPAERQQERNEFDAMRLSHALNNDLSIAYPILARHGFMETTPAGYRDPGGAGVIANRIRQLLATLSAN